MVLEVEEGLKSKAVLRGFRRRRWGRDQS